MIEFNGGDIREVEAALDNLGYDATVVRVGPSEYISSTGRGSVQISIHLEPKGPTRNE